VIKVCNDLLHDINHNDIDRAHRVGKNNETIIVKFHSFRKRTSLYKKRKDSSCKIHLDITKSRLELLDKATNLISNNVSNVDFVFADINCNTVARMKDGRYKFFNSIEKFREIFDGRFCFLST